MKELGSLARTLACAASLCAALALPSCGGGTGGGGPFTKVIFENNPLSPHAITQADFAYFPISGLPDRVGSVLVLPGENVEFDFAQGESDNFLDVTLTWSDLSTTVIPLVLVSGGEFHYPVTN